MRLPTSSDASASSSPSGAPVRCDTLSASATSSSPGAARRSSMVSSASAAGMPHVMENETRVNSERTGSRAWAPTNCMDCASECPEPSEIASAPKASGIASSRFRAVRRARCAPNASRATTGATSPKHAPTGERETTPPSTADTRQSSASSPVAPRSSQPSAYTSVVIRPSRSSRMAARSGGMRSTCSRSGPPTARHVLASQPHAA